MIAVLVLGALGAGLAWRVVGFLASVFLFGFVAGAIVGVAMMMRGEAGRRTALPFGPFLALGTVVAILVGQSFIDWVVGN